MIILSKVHLWSPQKLGHNQFFSALFFFYKTFEFLINWCTLKKAKFWDWISPNLVKFSHLSGVSIFEFFLFAKFTEKQFLKAHIGTLELSDHLKLKLAILALVWCFFWGLEKEINDEEVGYLSYMFDNWLWELFLARYVLLYLEFEFKFA